MDRNELSFHSGRVKFGFNTPHKFPSKVVVPKDVLDLTIQLYPTGRAWNSPENSNRQLLHSAINDSVLNLVENSAALIDSVFPDNLNFSKEDALFWENKLGLISNENLSLEIRRNIILNKISFPRNIKGRQSLEYIQHQILVHGFEVGVYENKFIENGRIVHKNPFDIFSQSNLATQHDDLLQHGNSVQHGDGNFEVIANSAFTENYSIGGDENLWSTFFLASKTNLNDRGIVAFNRKREFRELILKLKPANMVGFLFINYN